MKVIRVLDSSGDRVVNFDETDAGSRAEAEAFFTRMLSEGAAAFKVNRADGKSDEKTTTFSTLENETILVPRIIGG